MLTVEKFRKTYDLFGTALGGVFFVPALYASLILWIVLAQNLRTAVFAIAGLTLSAIIGHMLGLKDNRKELTVITANGLLASIAVAWLTSAADQLIEIQAIILIVTTIMVSLMAAASVRVFQKTPLPPLSIAYCFIIGLLFTLLPEWGEKAAALMPAFAPMDHLQNVGLNFLQSLGTVVFSPYPLTGILIICVFLIWSPTLFLTGVVGWCAGILTAFAMQRIGIEFMYLVSAHNYFFAGMLAGAVIFLPGRWNLLLAAAAGANAALLMACFQIIFEGSAFAYLPFPSIITCWIIIGALAFAVEKDLIDFNDDPTRPPEEAWWRARYWADRAGYPDPFVGVPVSGEVEIIQGFDGKFTHKGLWRHALDFQRQSTTIDPNELEKSTWGTPVYAPMSGIVEYASDRTNDNQPGLANYAENWGNYIIIRLDKGGWLLLAHFRRSTIAVTRGTRVVEGDYLGEIGNSGRSPYPHLHMQVQNAPEPGAPTIPFRLANYLTRHPDDQDNHEWHASGLPAESTLLCAAPRNPNVFAILSSVSPGKAVWHKSISGNVPNSYKFAADAQIENIEVALDQAGQLVFRDNRKNNVIISIDYDAWRVIENDTSYNPLLKLLALNSMSIPHAAKPGMKWKEPALLMPENPMGWWELFTAPYGKSDYIKIHNSCTAAPDSLQNTLLVETEFDRAKYDLPLKITGCYNLLRGPTSMVAEFENGKVTYTLQSFEPCFTVHQYS